MSYMSEAHENAYSVLSTIHNEITVTPGHYHMNYKCHYNSLQYAITEDMDIVSVICRDGTAVIAHFINVNKDGEYIENSVGSVGLYDRYFLVKTFKAGGFNANGELRWLKKYIFSNCGLNWFQKLIGGVTCDSF